MWDSLLPSPWHMPKFSVIRCQQIWLDVNAACTWLRQNILAEFLRLLFNRIYPFTPLLFLMWVRFLVTQKKELSSVYEYHRINRQILEHRPSANSIVSVWTTRSLGLTRRYRVWFKRLSENPSLRWIFLVRYPLRRHEVGMLVLW